jgi:hypothetical protein
MNKLSKYTFIFLVQFLCVGALISQDVMRIAGTQIVKKGETMTIEAGKLVQFEAGATLLVEGSLVVRGTVEKPVIFQSVDAQNPGNGVMVKGIEEGGSIAIENVRAEGLVQALRFDPFWYRKNVTLSGMTVSGSNSGEPVVYVAGPLLDLREGMDIQFSMTSMKFFNNTGSVLLEKVGSDGIVYSLDKLLFSENNLPGSDATMGVLHLDVARTVTAGQLKIGELAFNRNLSGSNAVGLSLSGGDGAGLEKLSAAAVYGEQVNALIYDNRVNSRVPSMEIAVLGGLNAYSDEKDFVVAATHTFGKVKMNVVGDPRVVKMEDSLGRPVFNNANRVGDTLVLSYLEGNPTVITLANGQKFMVPKLTAAQLPPPIYRKVDTTLISRIAIDSGSLKKLMGGGPLSWEYGAMFGAATYRGDYRHKFSPLPSTMEFSGSGFLQYNARKNTSFRLSLFRSNISMHYRNAPAVFSGMAPIFMNGSQGYLAETMGWRYAFVTKMGGVDLDMLMMLGDGRNYSLKSYEKGKWIPQLGLGVGLLTFTPFREYNVNVYDDQNVVVGSEYKMMNLRSVGTEGQNFLSGEKKYSSLAASANVSFQLTYLMQKWAFHAEIKSVFTSTDYLDDFGSGVWYGGDVDKWYESSPEAIDPNTGLKPYSSTMRSYYTDYVNRGYTTTQQRTKSLMPDGYFQFHLGMSYFLNNATSQKLSQSVSKFIPQERKVKKVKMMNLEIPKYADGDWSKNLNISFVGGGSIFIGDYKHKFFPLPSTIELSMGLTAEYNKTRNTSYRFGFYQSTVSMAYSNSIALFSSLKYPKIENNSGQPILVNMPNNWGFVNQMKIVDFDYIYLLNKQNTLAIGRNHQWNNKFSVGGGFLLHSPKRVEYWGSSKLIDLRELKTNDKKYGSLAMLFSVGYHLEYMRKRWTLGGEIKYAMTTTDNLDDYNSGSKYFGGDVDQWYMNSSELADANGVKPLSASMRDSHNGLISKGLAPDAEKSGFLPDGYMQFHLKLSYRIFKDPLNKK